MPIHSLACNTFIQGSVRLVGINLTPARMQLTNIWLGRLWNLVRGTLGLLLLLDSHEPESSYQWDRVHSPVDTDRLCLVY